LNNLTIYSQNITAYWSVYTLQKNTLLLVIWTICCCYWFGDFTMFTRVHCS